MKSFTSEYIEELWGPRCDEYTEGCACCDMWRAYDELEGLRKDNQKLLDHLRSWERGLAEAHVELDFLRPRLTEVIAFGKDCATGITGDPTDANAVNDFDKAMLAIRENVRLGYDAHNKNNVLEIRSAEAEALLDSAAVVIANTLRGSTHWEGCVDVHPACGTLKAIDAFRRTTDSTAHRENKHE